MGILNVRVETGREPCEWPDWLLKSRCDERSSRVLRPTETRGLEYN